MEIKTFFNGNKDKILKKVETQKNTKKKEKKSREGVGRREGKNVGVRGRL